MSDVFLPDHRDGKLRRLPLATLRFRLALPVAHRPLLDEEQPPSSLLARLRALGLLDAQATLLGYALPEREAVWWACMCVAHAVPDPMPPEQHRPLVAAENWVRQPDEERRQAALAAAKAAGYVSAGALAARAAFAARPAVAGSTRAGRTIDVAIRQAASCGDQGRTALRLRRFVASAEEIAAGGAGRLPREPDC